jgi:serine/threonine protein kinase
METGQKVAVKIMNPNIDQKIQKLILTEVSAMSILKHQHIINQIHYGQDMYVKDSGKVKNVSYIVLELAQGGEIFDFIANSGRFEEKLARYFFHQFMRGLQYCHNQGVAHRDLKPENLLLDENFDLKIADFGFAAPVEGRDGSGELHTKLGTLNYMAPEIHLKQPYEGKSVDLFAAAIILFIMVAQHPPFTTAQPIDPFYRCIAAGRFDIFWRTHCKNKEGNMEYFSEEFKDLVQAMVQLDAN